MIKGLSYISGGETVEDIVKETEHLRSIIQCTECGKNESNCLFLPCAHHIMCVSCAEEIEKCTKCNKTISHKIKTYMS